VKNDTFRHHSVALWTPTAAAATAAADDGDQQQQQKQISLFFIK
jgi:hypothetical protein